MYKIRIITDSGCDIPVKEKLHNVDILGFYITANGVSYEERKDITNKEYYKVLEHCDQIPATAHITMMRYGERYEALMHQGYTDVIVVTINAGGSATYDAAIMAKDLFYNENPDSKMNITVVDSNTYSIAYGWPIMQADKMIDEGKSPQQIIDHLKSEFSRIEILVSAFTLKFIKKSGRISAAAAFAGELLGLKPVITLSHGNTKLVGKARGDKMVIPAIIQQFKSRTNDTKHYIIGYTDEEYGKELYSACEKEFGVPPMLAVELGSAVATNAGNHSVGIVYYTGE